MPVPIGFGLVEDEPIIVVAETNGATLGHV
jgi:hypothetical protein